MALEKLDAVGNPGAPAVVRSGAPSTPSASAPLALAAALSKRSTRRLPGSDTYSAPLGPKAMPYKKRTAPKRLAVVPESRLVKSAWPSTPSAVAKLGLVAALS